MWYRVKCNHERQTNAMKISKIISSGVPSLSFEIFPPKVDTALADVKEAARKIAALSPSFMSVTYGAGGTTAGLTLEVADAVENGFGVTALAHMTCLSSDKSVIKEHLSALREKGIENVLALRGDVPAGAEPHRGDYAHASDLARDIVSFGGFCVGGACYPEGHPESPSQKEDIENLKIKAEAGCEFFTTQMFFDNNILYNFLYKIREAGIKVPVIAGIMPVTNVSQIKRICALSGTALPQRFKQIVDRYSSDPRAMAQAGIAYATEQIVDLYANGIGAVHVYSMNKPEVAEAIVRNVGAIIGRPE